MWGREMRAGLVFVLISVSAGGAFRAWQRDHQQRFDRLVASLVEADAEVGASAPAATAASATAGAASGDTLAGSSQLQPTAFAPHRRPDAPPLAPASMDVDRASVVELIRLPGIGPSLAARIVAERAANGPFGSPDGLRRVRGIGPKTLEKIRPYLTP